MFTEQDPALSPTKVRFHDPTGEPQPLVVADESASRLVAAGRCRVRGEARYLGLSGRVADSCPSGRAEFARAVGSGSPSREWGSFHRYQWGCSLRTPGEHVSD